MTFYSKHIDIKTEETLNVARKYQYIPKISDDLCMALPILHLFHLMIKT